MTVISLSSPASMTSRGNIATPSPPTMWVMTIASATTRPAGTRSTIGATNDVLSAWKTSAGSPPTTSMSDALGDSTRSPSAPVTLVAAAPGSKRDRSSSAIRL